VIGDRHVWIYASRVNWRTCYDLFLKSNFETTCQKEAKRVPVLIQLSVTVTGMSK